MSNENDDDSFINEFIARAQKRQVKLSQIEEPKVVEQNQDVSYPALSPLPEEEDNEDSETLPGPMHRNKSSLVENGHHRSSSCESDLDYSADLSLSPTCDNDTDDVVYRAQLVHCNSSPDLRPARKEFIPPQASPRKQLTTQTLSRETNSNQEFQLQTQPEPKPTYSQSLPEISTEDLINDLEIQARRAFDKKLQLKKVIEIAKHGSKEHLEAARLLQITELEHLNFNNQKAKAKEGMRRESESLGSITISDIRLKISSKLRNDLADSNVCHYFFCVATCGPKIMATELLSTDDIRRQDLKAHIQFKDKIFFDEMPPSFNVKIEIFELVIGQHLPNFLSRLTPSKKSKMTPESYFRRVGSLKLTLEDRDITYKNLTQWSKQEESKYIERECKLRIELRPQQLPSKAGMLHVRCLDHDGRPDWSRYYVDLSDGRLRFWKSKQDYLDEKKPNQVIEFHDICSKLVQKLTPDDDLYRQNSFVVYSLQQVVGGEKENLFQRVLKDDHKIKIVKHQLAAETKDDRDSWCSILEGSIQCFREWHGKTRVFTLDELKDMFLTNY